MKRNIMAKGLINEILNIKKIMGLLNEDTELSTQSSDLSKVKNLLELNKVDIDVSKILDNTEPICEPPKKLDNEDNEIVSKYWNWANDRSNENQLKDVFKTIKNILYDDSDLSENITFDGVELGRDKIKKIGETLLAVSVVGLIPKMTNCNK